MPTSDDFDKPWGLPEGTSRGIFTDADREFLLKDPEERYEDYHRSSRIGAWNRIRERLHFGIIDFKNCLYILPDSTRREVFEGLFYQQRMFVSHNVISECIGFLLLGLLEERDTDLDDDGYLEKVIERSLDRMLWGSDQRIGVRSATIDVDVNIDGWESSNDYDRHFDPEDMTRDQLHGMYVMGALSQEEFARAVLSDELEDDD